MTNPLEILKNQLEKTLDETSETEDFKESLRDAINACNLNSVAALEQWLYKWVDWQKENEVNRNDDHDYLQGINFVEEKWHAITGMF